jgi:AmmeMemoRadiSam system protein B
MREPPMETPVLRPPAVAGRFYPAQPDILKRDLTRYLSAEPEASPVIDGALGCVAPHAGYMYSGHVAGAVYRRLPARPSYIILCPNHTGRGEPLAMMSSGAWQTPLGAVAVDQKLAEALRDACHMLKENAEAHADEHAIEVQLPFLQLRVGDFRFVPIAVGVGNYTALEFLGHCMAHAVQTASTPVMIVASSDMNHYEPDNITRVKDRKAIDQILALDPHGLYDVVRREHISMCGYGPTVAMITAALELGAKKAELVKYATSADTSGDRSAVVGYAGVILS